MLFIIGLIVFCGIALATAFAVVEKDSSIKNFLQMFVCGCAGAVWTLFLATYIVPQII